jgi:hypothetical protein
MKACIARLRASQSAGRFSSDYRREMTLREIGVQLGVTDHVSADRG